MGIDETSIKMFEKAEEIQEANIKHIQRQGGLPVNEPFYDYDGECYFFKDRLAIIWLPTQEQLQKMLISDKRDFVELLEDFYWHWAGYKTDEEHPWREYIEDGDKARIRQDFTSMEQLWLAFVMKMKYQKIWNGEDWVKV